MSLEGSLLPCVVALHPKVTDPVGGVSRAPGTGSPSPSSPNSPSSRGCTQDRVLRKAPDIHLSLLAVFSLLNMLAIAKVSDTLYALSMYTKQRVVR